MNKSKKYGYKGYILARTLTQLKSDCQDNNTMQTDFRKDRIREAIIIIMRDVGINQTQFAERMRVTSSHISRIIAKTVHLTESGGPSELFLGEMVHVFGLNSGYFAGESDQLYQRPRNTIDRTKQVLMHIMVTNHLTPEQLAEQCGVPEGYIVSLARGDRGPSSSKVLASQLVVFNLNPDYIDETSDEMFIERERGVKRAMVNALTDILEEDDNETIEMVRQFLMFVRDARAATRK